MFESGGIIICVKKLTLGWLNNFEVFQFVWKWGFLLVLMVTTAPHKFEQYYKKMNLSADTFEVVWLKNVLDSYKLVNLCKSSYAYFKVG